MNRRILSAVLARANSAPPVAFTDSFYAVKRHLLSLYGVQSGVVNQRITKACWGDPRFGCGDDCDRCGGTGIYSTTVIQHDQWRLCRRTFLSPARRLIGVEAASAAIHIEGPVQHRKMKHARDCWSALFVLFAPHLFRMATDTPGGVLRCARAMRIVGSIGPVPTSHVMLSSSTDSAVPF